MHIFLCLFLSLLSLFLGVPEAAEVEVRSITGNLRKFELRWTKPKDNGSPITSYTIYTMLIEEDDKETEWRKEKALDAAAVLYNITLEWGKHYKIIITATNDFGEAKKEDSRIEVIKVPNGRAVLLYFIVRCNMQL